MGTLVKFVAISGGTSGRHERDVTLLFILALVVAVDAALRGLARATVSALVR